MPRPLLYPVLLAAPALLSAQLALAATYEWVDAAGIYDGTFNSSTRWDAWTPNPTPPPAELPGDGVGGDGPPGIGGRPFFNNGQPAAYTVGFTGDVETHQIRVGADRVTFDLAGHRWRTYVDPAAPFDYTGAAADSAWWIAGGADESATVTVSSSVAAVDPAIDNVINTHSYGAVPYDAYRALVVGNYTGTTVLNIDESLGAGATWVHRGNFFTRGATTINIDGPTSHFNGELAIDFGFGAGGDSTLNLTNGGRFTANGGFNAGTWHGHTVINVLSGSTLATGSGNIGHLNSVAVNVNTGGTWNFTNHQLGLYQFYNTLPVASVVTVDGPTSSINGSILAVGTNIDHLGNAELTVRDQAVAWIKDSLTIRPLSASAVTAGKAKNTVTLDAGLLELGQTAGGTPAIQVHGVFRGNGDISLREGASPIDFRVFTGGELRPGDLSGTPAAGLITASDTDLTTESGSTTFFNLGLSGYDQIVLTAGDATLQGSMDYSALPGFAFVGDERFEFLWADTITFAPASDNIAAFMLSQGFGPGDYTYGVETVGSQQVLFLEVPEPASAGLLLAGGLLMLRRKRV